MSDDADRLRELGKQLPFDRPDHERREAVRSSLLVAATQAEPSTARKRWLLAGGGFAAGALAAAAIAVVVVSPREPAAPIREAHARIDAPPTANLEHTVTATTTGTDEVVRVRAGVVRVAVPEVKRGDRVRMQTADAEIEGTGAYEVAVVDDRLERVTVSEGSARVKVRVQGEQQHVFLSAGQTWRPKIVTADIALTPPAPDREPSSDDARPAPADKPGVDDARPAPADKPGVDDVKPTKQAAAPPSAPTTVPKSSPARVPDVSSTEPEPVRMPAVTTLDVAKASVKQPSPTEQHFQAGWALLRAGKAHEAAVELGAAADAGGDDPLATDARYFQAVALVRAGDGNQAERVLVAFLDRAPHSLRRGRAAILLGKLLRDRGDTKSARAWFESAQTDADPAIAAAAKAHLDALAPPR